MNDYLKIETLGRFSMKEAITQLQIKSLEEQIKILRARIETPKQKKTLADLYGIFEGKMDLSLEEIRRFKYKLQDLKL